jgi:hypothetical protein
VNWKASESLEPGLGTVELPGLKGRPSVELDPEGDWLCAACLGAVANDRDRFCFGGKDEFIFANPAGFRFQIITFLQTRACRESGVPTLAHTWFPGHAWSFCQCGGCGQHLGWYYAGPHSFVGLIKERIVRALWVRN